MKITVEFDSLDEFNAFRSPLRDETAQALAEAGREVAQEMKKATETAEKPKRKRRTKKEIEAEKVLKAMPAEVDKVKAEAEPEPVLTVVPEPETASPVTTEDELEVEDVKTKFKQLVSRDYDTAAEVLISLGCETFSDVIEQGKAAELGAAIDKVIAA